MRMLIGQDWVDKSEKIEVHNPYNGELVDTVPAGSPEDVNAALEDSTGFDYMVSPWLHYEITERKFTNNLIYRAPGMPASPSVEATTSSLPSTPSTTSVSTQSAWICWT